MIRMFKTQLLLLVFGCCLYPMTAQKKSFSKGYIIEQSGDTIQGLVKDRAPEPFVSLYPKIRFRKEGSSRTRRYGPDDILGYGYHGQNFVSIPFREESAFFKFRYYTDASAPRAFLKVIRRSKELVYYEQLFVHDDNCYLDSFPLFHKPNSNELVRVTQGIFGFKRKQLAAYFSDCPELHQEIYADKRKVESVSELFELCLVYCTE